MSIKKLNVTKLYSFVEIKLPKRIYSYIESKHLSPTSKAQKIEEKRSFLVDCNVCHKAVQSDNIPNRISSVMVYVILGIITKVLNLNKTLTLPEGIYRTDDICSQCHHKFSFIKTHLTASSSQYSYTITFGVS